MIHSIYFFFRRRPLTFTWRLRQFIVTPARMMMYCIIQRNARLFKSHIYIGLVNLHFSRGIRIINSNRVNIITVYPRSLKDLQQTLLQRRLVDNNSTHTGCCQGTPCSSVAVVTVANATTESGCSRPTGGHCLQDGGWGRRSGLRLSPSLII